MPGLQVGGDTRATEPQRVVADDQLARPGRGDEPALHRQIVTSRERDVLVLQAMLGWQVQDGRSRWRGEPIDEALQRLVGLLPGHRGCVLYVGHRRVPLVAMRLIFTVLPDPSALVRAAWVRRGVEGVIQPV